MTETDVQQRAEDLVRIIRDSRLAAPPCIRFGCGQADRIPQVAADLVPRGRVLLVLGGRSSDVAGRRAALEEGLARAGLRVVGEIPVAHEPTVAAVNTAAQSARELNADAVLAVGGGSVLDTGKAIAALLTNPGSVEDYLEGVGRGFQVERDPVPLMAVPTTSGTGAEMTKNAVVADYAKGFKKSMRDVRMIPAAALLDPLLTLSVPREVTAASGMDAITQLIEPCLSTKRGPAVTRIAHRALEGTREALAACCRDPSDRSARSVMTLASGISGVALANAGLGLVHGIASGLGGLHRVAHGLICGILLPHALRFNREACAPELGESLRRFLGHAALEGDTIDRGIQAIDALKQQTGVPPDLAFLGLNDAQVREVAEHSMGSSMSANPIAMSPDSIYDFLRPLT